MTKVEFGKDKYHLQQEMVQWCLQNLGTGGWRKPDFERWGDQWGIESAYGNTFFYFLEEKNATAFMLKWC